MNRTIAALTIATVAVLGLTACSSAAGESTTDDTASGTTSESTTQEETTEEETGGQSVAEACATVGAVVADAQSELTSIDINTAASDPQGTIDAFSATVDSIGKAADAVSNADVKAAATEMHDVFATVRDVYTKILIDGDVSAAAEMSTAANDLAAAATAFSEVCSG